MKQIKQATLNKEIVPEILAPAGSPQALEAALACGADAVYLGLDSLNARRNAENFTTDKLAELVRQCHVRGTKVYLTLNILLRDGEFSTLAEVARCACEAGADAAIVQDLGAAAFLRRTAPGLRLHASTQMTVHNPDGVKLLEQLGFSRVVLARECSAREIETIVRFTPLEVEMFVHGAQCMSLSGQCYMSAVLGQRSGNRGLCAQPCRLAFASSECAHALSLKDMSVVSRLREVQALGVRSLKIEGRMKRPEYVAAAITACRAALAGELVDTESLQSVFSRSGFTDGYFLGERTLDMFGIREKEDVTAATGVLGQLENLYTNPRRHVQKVGVEFAFAMKPDTPAFLSAVDSDGHSVCAEGPVPETALNKPTDEERVKAALEKTGGTPYRVDAVRCSIAEGLMLPASAINAMRRDVLEQLDAVRGAAKTIGFSEQAATEFLAETAGVIQPRTGGGKLALRITAEHAAQVSARILAGAQLVTLPAAELARMLREGTLPDRAKLCVGIPRILFEGRDALAKQLQELYAAGITHASVGNPGALMLAQEIGFSVHIEPFFNVMNSAAAHKLETLGADDLTVSWELTLDAALRLNTKLPVGAVVYGRLALMTVRVCPVKVSAGCARCKAGENYVTDRRKEKLTVSCAYGCTELLNPHPLYMADRLNELAGLDFAVLRFTTEDAAECERIFDAYAGGGGKYAGEFTRGLLYKSVL